MAPGGASPCAPPLRTVPPTHTALSPPQLPRSHRAVLGNRDRKQKCSQGFAAAAHPRCAGLCASSSVWAGTPSSWCCTSDVPANQRGKSHVNGLRTKGRRSFAVLLHRSTASAGRVCTGLVQPLLCIFLGGTCSTGLKQIFPISICIPEFNPPNLY